MKVPGKDANRIDWAACYIDQSYAPIPIPLGEKNPNKRGWQKLRIGKGEVEKYFAGTGNIGLLTGNPSSGLTDVDLDSLEAVHLAPEFLPSTTLVSGRASKPCSHFWYRGSKPPKSEKFDDIDGTTLCEIRSDEHQTVVPPSTHPSGEAVVWEKDGDPADVTAGDLRCQVTYLATASLLARHWPEQGSRHNAAMAAAGFLLRGGIETPTAVAIITGAARAAGDDEWAERERDVLDTEAAITAGKPATGGPNLQDLLYVDGKKVLAKVSKWLELKNKGQARGPQSQIYNIEDGRIVRLKFVDGAKIVEPLCNFVARIESEVVLDDGLERSRAFDIEGMLDDGTPLSRCRVPASKYNTMAWVTEYWGARAVVRAGQATRDSLREAVQRLSPMPRQIKIFRHTGWAIVANAWVYVTANGVAGHPNVDVDLPELSHYSFPLFPEDPIGAIKASFDLLKLAPLRITAPLLAIVYRAPLIAALPADFATWLEGQTGSFKSTIAALNLGHYGPFERLSLPGSWSSTANQLERRAFTLKDALFVIDDYAPASGDARELENKAARLLRAQGNGAGRGRLRADLTERPSFFPRCIVLSTGEQHPGGQSLLARTIVIELSREEVNQAMLSQAQRAADRLPHAMAGYIGWLAPQMSKLPALLEQTFQGARQRASSQGEHLRIPEILAHLWVGLQCALNYAIDIEAFSEVEAKNIGERCWKAFVELGAAQGKLVEEERPSGRFLRVLWTLLTQGRVFLRPKSESSNEPQGSEFIGWQDGDFLYLLSEGSYKVVAKFCQEMGEPFATRLDRLRRDLAKEGISDCDEGRRTSTGWLDGHSRRVIKLRIDAIESVLGEKWRPDLARPDHSHHSHRSQEGGRNGL